MIHSDNIDIARIAHQYFLDKKTVSDTFDFDVFIKLCNQEMEPSTLSVKQLYFYALVLNSLYRIAEPVVSDDYYDHQVFHVLEKNVGHYFLESDLARLDEENFPFSSNDLIDDFSDKEMFTHPKPMLSTEKAYSIQEFTKKFVNKLSHHNLDQIEVRVTPKLDGIAGRDDLINLYTRGDGQKGYNIGKAYQQGLRVYSGQHDCLIDRVEGVGEIVVFKSYFDTFLSDEFDHPRTFVGGAMKSDELNQFAIDAFKEEKIVFVPYQELNTYTGSLQGLIDQFDAIIDEVKSGVDFYLDGVIVELTDPDLKAELGSATRFHKWQIAIKQVTEIGQTKLNSIALQTGRLGRITPVAELETIYLSGASISRATLHNHGFIEKHQIGPNAILKLTRSGEVIPKILSCSVKGDSVVLPTHCPCCQSELSRVNDTFYCLNKSGCSAQAEGMMLNWFKVIGQIDGFGPVAIKRLFDHDVRHISDIYALKESDYVAMGFGQGETANLLKSLRYARTKEINDTHFLAAMGVKFLGRRMSTILLSKYTLSELLDAVEFGSPQRVMDEWKSFNGLGVIKVPAIFEGLKAVISELRALLSLGFNLIEHKSTLSNVVTDSFISGKKVVFTGAMQKGNRGDMEKHARDMGADVQSSVNSKTNLLVVGEKAGSKLAKAQSLGVQVMTEDEYIAALG